MAYTRFELIESSIFTRQVAELLTENSYREFQLYRLRRTTARIYLVYMFAKNVRADLTAGVLRVIRRHITED